MPAVVADDLSPLEVLAELGQGPGDLTAEQKRAFADWPWPWTARPSQRIPWEDPDWRVLLLRAGRRGGKSRAVCEGTHEAVLFHDYRRVVAVGTTAGANRDTLADVLMATGPASVRPVYEPGLKLITWPNGARCRLRSAAEPTGLRGVTFDGRGPDLLVFDELGAYRPVRGEHVWDVARPAMMDAAERPPRILVATTPNAKAQRSLRLLRELGERPTTILRTWGSRRNARNLDPDALSELEAEFAGTRMGRQELGGELLEDVDGALWSHAMLEAARTAPPVTRANADRIAVAIDPAVSTGEDSDRTAIAVVARSGDRFGVLAANAGRWSPEQWARRAIAMYRRSRAGALIAEVNQGGDMVAHTLRQAGGPPVRQVRVTRSKEDRAAPVALLYEQGKAYHAPGLPDELADELLEFPVGDGHDDLVDAVVLAASHLMLRPEPKGGLLW